jgi:MFS family permease
MVSNPPTPPARPSLWRHPDFLKLWGGQSVSQIGTQVTSLALPSAAILLLHAGPAQVGLLGALQFLAFPVLGLFVGVCVDRLPRRPLLVACDTLRLATLASVPLAWWAGVLSLGQLFAVAAVTGVGTVFFDVAYQSYLPDLIDRADLVAGNSRLQSTASAAGVVGPALAGFLIQLAGSAKAVAADASSYAVSVLTLLWIRRPESVRSRRRAFFQELAAGVRLVVGHPSIRLIVAATATSNLGSYGIAAVYLLFAYRRLHLSPTTVGEVEAIGSAAAVAGAVLASRLASWLGLGRVLVLSMAVGGLAGLLIPLATLAVPVVFLALAGLGQAAFTVYNINQVSYRQALVPVELQGRLNATVRTAVWGTLPLGSALGGLAGAHFGLVPTLYLGATLETLAVAWLLLGPVRLREIPAPA